MNKTEEPRGSVRPQEMHSSEWQIDSRLSLCLFLPFSHLLLSVCAPLAPKLQQEVGLFVSSTCDPRPSMRRSPKGGQGGSGQTWVLTSG